MKRKEELLIRLEFPLARSVQVTDFTSITWQDTHNWLHYTQTMLNGWWWWWWVDEAAS